MTYFSWPPVILFLVIAFFFPFLSAYSDEPQQGVVFTNKVGGYQNRFVLCPKGQVSGSRYRIRIPVRKNGQVVMKNFDDNLDRLTFVQDYQIKDRQNLLNGWLYRSSDKSNSAEVFFSKNQLGQGNYPIYYKLGGQSSFSRWQTDGGTQRREISFEDRVSAAVWANQVEVRQLGLNPFNPKQTHPIIVTGFWMGIEPDLNKLPELGGQLSYLPLVLKNGSYQIDLAVPHKTKQRLFTALRNSSDLPVGATLRATTKMVVNTQQLNQEILSVGKVDFSKVSKLMERTINVDAPKLASLNPGSNKQVSSDACIVAMEDWMPLCGDANDVYFWKLKLRFKTLDADQKNFELACLVDIGSTARANNNLGQELIKLRIPDIANFEEARKFTIGFDGQSANPASHKVVVPISTATGETGVPDGVNVVANSSIAGTRLNDLYQECFTTFSKKVVR